MSLATYSPPPSSDDFSDFDFDFEAELDSDSEVDSDDDADRSKRRKLDQLEIQGSALMALPEDKIEKTYSSNKDMCKHPAAGTFGKICFACGKIKKEKSGVAFGFIHRGLRLNREEISQLCDSDMSHRKLHLVLDLDHTLLNSTCLLDLTREEGYLKNQTDSLDDVSTGSLFMMESIYMMTKLRPFVQSFLRDAREMFEMYIYTMGARVYARQMAKLLDPKGEYFGDRIISRDDSTVKHQKSLDVVMSQESKVLILDDSEDVWLPKHRDNLILVERYHYFTSSCQQFGLAQNFKFPSQLKSDESERDGALSTVLEVLKQIHGLFFNDVGEDEDLSSRDVRQILKEVRREILKGCKIVFSHVFPTKFQAENHHLWMMAEQLGARCSTKLDSSVTHVVSKHAGTEKSQWAIKEEKHLVHPSWIEAANYLWHKQPEENFPIQQLK